MRYYEAHDAEYLKRISSGHAGWDAGAYDDFFMRPFVARDRGRVYALAPGAVGAVRPLRFLSVR